jgi:hypothetical protein
VPHSAALRTAAGPAPEQNPNAPAAPRRSAKPAPGSIAPVSASGRPLALAASAGWSIAYDPDPAETPAPISTVARPPAAAPPLDAGAPAGLPTVPGLDDRAEALALALWNEGRQAEAIAFLEDQVALARHAGEAVPAADPAVAALPIGESHSLPAVLPPAALLAAKRPGPFAIGRSAALLLGIGLAAVLVVAAGAELLSGSESDIEPAAPPLLAAAEMPAAPDAAKIEAAAPPSNALSTPAAAELARLMASDGAAPRAAATPARIDAPDAGETSVASVDARPAEPTSVKPAAEPHVEATAERELLTGSISGLARPLDPPSSPRVEETWSGAAPLDEIPLESVPAGGAASAPPARIDAPPAAEAPVAAVQPAAEPDAASPPPEAAEVRPAGAPAVVEAPVELSDGEESAEESLAALDAGAEQTEATDIFIVTEDGPPLEPLLEELPPEPVGEAALAPPLEATPVIADPRLPKPRPNIAVAAAPARPKPQAAGPVPQSAGSDADRPVLLGRPRGPVSARLAERRAAAEEYAARRRAVAEWRAARRARIVLLGRPYQP